jgi:hypothetical protein
MVVLNFSDSSIVKIKIRNPNIEIRNNTKIQMIKIPNKSAPEYRFYVWVIIILVLSAGGGFRVSIFEFRICPATMNRQIKFIQVVFFLV